MYITPSSIAGGRRHDPSNTQGWSGNGPHEATPGRAAWRFALAATGMVLWGCFAALVTVAPSGCGSDFKVIDRHVERLVTESTADLSPTAVAPRTGTPLSATIDSSRDFDATRLVSANPEASSIPFTAADDADAVLDRLAHTSTDKTGELHVDLKTALATAMVNAREYRFAEESYLLAALRLLVERHRWGPRFFAEVGAEAVTDVDGGLYDSSVELLSEARVTQQLPYGGTVSARALATATEDLHKRVNSEGVQSAQLILEADIPLLRGAGNVAREDRIQSERDLIYAARDFELFRRDFLFEITSDFLDLVVAQQSIANAQRQVESLVQLEARERTLYEKGRSPRFQSALAEQDTVFARDRLASLQDSYRLAVDRFKIRIGLPVDQAVAIVPEMPALPIPKVDVDDAVRAAMAWRLDLQTSRDQVDDAQRQVRNAENDLLPDLDFTASASIPTEGSRRRAGLDFDADESVARAGLRLGLPIDRRIERLTVRQADITLQRAGRSFDELRDTIAVEVRAAAREIDRSLFSLTIQQRNIEIAEQRLASIQAAPDRATVRDSSEAVEDLLQAQDQRDAARRDLQISVLDYLRQTGTLRVAADGSIIPLDGMVIPPPLDVTPKPSADVVLPPVNQPAPARPNP